jgi:hypothetical protein
MQRRLRFLLLWLVVLALPVKGLAAATGIGCAASAQGSGATMVAAHGHAGVPHGAPAAHAHHHDGATSQAAPAGPGAAVADAHAGSDCVSCAPCCGALAPPVLDLAVPAALPQAHGPAVVAGLRVGGMHGVPERPPRPVSLS